MIKSKFKQIKNYLLDIILLKLVQLNPNHCYKQIWEEEQKRLDTYNRVGKKYYEEANTKYSSIKPLIELAYSQDLYYKYNEKISQYKDLLRAILADNRLEEIKKRL